MVLMTAAIRQILGKRPFIYHKNAAEAKFTLRPWAPGLPIFPGARQYLSPQTFPLPWYSGAGLGWGWMRARPDCRITGSPIGPNPHLDPPPEYRRRKQALSSVPSSPGAAWIDPAAK